MIRPNVNQENTVPNGRSYRFALRRRQWFDLAIGEPNLVGSKTLKNTARSIGTPLNTEYRPRHVVFPGCVNQTSLCLVVRVEVINGAG
jgi:hypothetical protein